MIIDSGIATGSFLVLGPYTQTGSADINGVLTVTDGITGSLFGTSSYAVNSDLLDGLNSSAFTLTSSFNSFTSSYYINSASFSASIAALQDFSSSIDTGYVTEAELNAATASLSSSIGILSSSYLASSASFDTRISNVSSSVGILSSSYLASSASFNTNILNNSSSIGILSSSYLASSASFNTGILNVSSSVGILSSSYLASSASFNSRINASNTGSFNGAFTGSFSGSLWNLQNTIVNHIPYFSSSQVLADSSIIQIDNGYSVAINQNGVTTAAPEALYVWQPSTSSFNVISGKGNLNSYLQLNIQNVSEGDTASSDVVASVANSTETLNYIDMGINGPGFTEKPGYSVGGANDTYLLSVANNHYIGSATSGKITIFTGPDFNGEENAKIILRANNQHELTGSFKVDGSLTGSLFGTASNATSASYAVTASFAQNFNPASTASYALFAVSASYAATASYASNFTVAGTLTAQTLNVQTVSSSVIYSSGSNIFGNSLSNTQKFTGSVQITGSLTVNNSSVILTNQTSSMTVLSSSYALTASYASNVPVTASYAISASQAQNAVSSSYALTASYASNVPLTASFAISSSQATNANNALTASYVNPLVQNLILTGSLLVSGSANFNNSVAINDANVNLTNSSSLNLTSGSGIYVDLPGVISGSIVGIGNVTAFSGSVDSRLTALETLIDGGTY